MKQYYFLLKFTAFLVVGIANQAFAEEEKSPHSSDIQFFFGVKPWATTWNVPLLDAAIILANNSPALKIIPVEVQSDVKIVPIISTGIRHKNIVLAANFFPTTGYSTESFTNEPVKRNEWDLSVGYAVSSNVLLSLAYKYAKINNQFTNNTASILPGLSSNYTVKGALLGVNAIAPLQDRLSLYGNFAIGPAQLSESITDRTSTTKRKGLYKISEVGFTYRFSEPTNSISALNDVTFQLGYRSQTVSIRNFAYSTVDLNSNAVISSEKHDRISTTQGIVIGVMTTF